MEELCRLLNAGRFISRGKGRHATRVIDSYELILVIAGTGFFDDADDLMADDPGVGGGGVGPSRRSAADGTLPGDGNYRRGIARGRS